MNLGNIYDNQKEENVLEKYGRNIIDLVWLVIPA